MYNNLFLVSGNFSKQNYFSKIKKVRRIIKLLTVVRTRYHFIKLKLPNSYRELIENDVLEDYTMGYASKMGFRAGVCHPFKFYDLDYDSPTQLTVYPFYLMEATVKYYFKEDYAQAFPYFQEYIDKEKVTEYFNFLRTYNHLYEDIELGDLGKFDEETQAEILSSHLEPSVVKKEKIYPGTDKDSEESSEEDSAGETAAFEIYALEASASTN